MCESFCCRLFKFKIQPFNFWFSFVVVCFAFLRVAQHFPLSNVIYARLLGNSKWMGNSWAIVLHLILHLTRTTWCWSAERHFNCPLRYPSFRESLGRDKWNTTESWSHFPQLVISLSHGYNLKERSEKGTFWNDDMQQQTWDGWGCCIHLLHTLSLKECFSVFSV